MKKILDLNTIVENCFRFNTNGNNYAEFIYCLEWRDYLSVKNWIFDAQGYNYEDSSNDKPLFLAISKEDAIANKFIYTNIKGLSIYFKLIEGDHSFVGAISKSIK
jgi:hypothetical protein